MGWMSYLFGSPAPTPVPQFTDVTFGSLNWSDEDESWVGKYGDYSIAIGYTRQQVPQAEILDYAKEFLGEKGVTFTETFARERAAHADEFQRWAAEFGGLRVEALRFFISKRGLGCFIDLTGGEKFDRYWRCEFDGMQCEGFGFDT